MSSHQSIFGPIVTGWEVERAVLAHLKNWMPTYMGEIERRTGLTAQTLPLPRSWTVSPEAIDKWPEDQLPAVVCVSTGLVGEPHKEGGGDVRATWSIGLATVCSANTEDKTHYFAKLYFAALRAAMLEHESLGDFAESTVWKTEEYDVWPTEQRRTIAAGYGIFEVAVAEVLNTRSGPIVPLASPYVDPGVPPEFEDHEVEVDKL